MPEQIRTRAERAIAERVFPGCAIGVVLNGTRHIEVRGALRYDGLESVSEDTIYDLASVTKSVPLASLALVLAREGTVSLAEKATVYISELRDEHGATLEDLLQYRVRGPRMSTLHFSSHEEVRTHVFERGFDGPPGDRAYANAPAFVLGEALERATGSTLQALSEEYFFKPHGMHDTSFFPQNAARCAPTEFIDGIEVQGIVHDESARIFSRAGRAVGHAGLFSTAPDLLSFLEALLNNHFPQVVEGALRGLGWQVNDPHFMGTLASQATIGKTGFTGTSIVLDTERGIGLIILSNRTYPARGPDTDAINAFRRDIADIAFGSK